MADPVNIVTLTNRHSGQSLLMSSPAIPKLTSAYTRDTVLNLVAYARNQLPVTDDGTEEALTGYGFNVVVGSAKNPTPAPAKTK